MKLPLALLLMCLPVGTSAGTAGVALLRQVSDAWLEERDRWAFTQHVREFDGQRVKEERVERYDPGRGYAARWQLISINGAEPTPEQREAWTKRKNRKKRTKPKEAAESFDFANAKLVAETPTTAVYELPLRSNIEWLFPISKVELLVTINKRGPSLEQVQARISEPFRVALGIARVLDVDLDLQMEPPPAPDPADAKPSGTAEVVVSRFGDRVEYAWSGFERVGPSALERERGRSAE